MSVASGIVTYIVLWWTVLFAVLPWKAHAPANPEPGHATSAPENPRLLWKAKWTTIITTGIWLAIFALVEADVVSFRDLANRPLFN